MLYFNTFDFFKKCENEEQLDPNENATEIIQGENCELIINGIKLNSESGLVNVILNAPHLNKQQFSHLFCMYYLKKNSGIRRDLKIFDERLKKFGNSMLIIYNPMKFMSRLNKALDNAYKNNDFIYAESKPVEYIDFNTYNGEIEAFRKNKHQFEHQSEWRLAILREQYNDDYKLYVF